MIVARGIKNHERFCSENPAAEKNRAAFAASIARARRKLKVSAAPSHVDRHGFSVKITVDQGLANRIAEKLIGAEFELTS
jgi:hypothetical protein